MDVMEIESLKEHERSDIASPKGDREENYGGFTKYNHVTRRYTTVHDMVLHTLPYRLTKSPPTPNRCQLVIAALVPCIDYSNLD